MEQRALYKPRYPEALDTISSLSTESFGNCTSDVSEDQQKQLKGLFPKTYGQPVIKIGHSKTTTATKDAKPLKVAVILSGGQAPGGHNVICGLYEAMQQVSPDSQLIGFKGGSSGILKDDYLVVDKDTADHFRNTGGFNMLGSGRAKIESAEQFATCAKVLERHNVDGLVVIGGDDSNTNAALLAEYFKAKNSKVKVIGVPKTIDGDLKNKYVEASFGFDTAVRLYSELISNISRDAQSAKKYYHFIRLMGRAASHITLEAALQTHPNIVLISEEVELEKKGLFDVVEDIVQVIVQRNKVDKNYGIILVPEGLIEFIPEIKALFDELNDILATNSTYLATLHSFTSKNEYINHKLSKDGSYTFSSLPTDIQRQLLMDRDPHGNVQVSRIETEKLLIELVESRLRELKSEGVYTGDFAHQSHFLGYEGRCAAPTNFDADYAYSLGLTAGALLHLGVTGYMSVVKNLTKSRDQWQAVGVPLTTMMNIEQRNGQKKPVIKKSLVSLSGAPFAKLKEKRENWILNDDYRFSGAIQYFGPPEVCDQLPKSLRLESDDTQSVDC